jgi:hypothetical protein
MRKFILTAVAVASLGVAAIAPAVASADAPHAPAQCPISMTANFTVLNPAGAVTQWNTVWTHHYTVQFNPCNGQITSGSGTVASNDPSEPQSYTETVTSGHIADGRITFTAERPDGYWQTITNAPMDGATVTDATSNPTFGWTLVETKVSPLQITGVQLVHGGDQHSDNDGMQVHHDD